MLEATYAGLQFRIEADYPEVGVYLYVYDGETCVRDDLQNDVETCKRVAFEDYGVPFTAWN